MKKILVLTAILVLAATSSFAGGASGATGDIDFATTGKSLHADVTGGTASASTSLIGKCSTGVDVAWNTSTTGYALMTQHLQGTKAYGSSYDSTALYQTTSTSVDPGTAAYNGGALTAVDTTDFVTGWKAM